MGREPVEPDPASTGGGIGMRIFIARCVRVFHSCLSTCAVSTATAADDSSLEEVVVTAELRDRTLRDLPASATVLDAHTLEVAGVQHFQDVLGLVPNLNWSAGTSRPRLFPAARHRRARAMAGRAESLGGFPHRRHRFLRHRHARDAVRRRAHRSAARTAGHGVWRERARRAHRREHARRRDANPRSNANVTFGDYGTRGANGVLGGPSATAKPRGVSSPATIAATAFAAIQLSRIATTPTATTRATRACKLHAQPTETLRVDVTAMWVDLDNGYDAFSIDNSRTTLVRQARPGHAARARARGAARLQRRAQRSTSSAGHRVRNFAQRLFVRWRLGQRRQLGRELALRLFPAIRPRAHAR